MHCLKDITHGQGKARPGRGNARNMYNEAAVGKLIME